jgi:hypothetical protein
VIHSPATGPEIELATERRIQTNSAEAVVNEGRSLNRHLQIAVNDMLTADASRAKIAGRAAVSIAAAAA